MASAVERTLVGPNYDFLEPGTCDNFNLPGRCGKKGGKYCKNCHLVQYCSAGCQKENWSSHKLACKSALGKRQDWLPSYVRESRIPQPPVPGVDCVPFNQRKYVWGNLPEYDLLNLASNKGKEYNKDLDLLFIASGDLRNVMKTVLELPPSYKKTCTITINDRDEDIVLRNAIILLLAFHFSNGEASELIVHLWYSSSLSSHMYQKGVIEKLLPDIREIGRIFVAQPDINFVSRVWTFDNLRSTLRLNLLKDQWLHILRVFERKNRLPLDIANLHRRNVMSNPPKTRSRDGIEDNWFRMPSFHRLCDKKWREDGLLLPFGYEATGFDIPNPCNSNQWIVDPSPAMMPVMGSHLSLDGKDNYSMPLNDINGWLFFQRREMVQNFCRSISSLKLDFVMYQLDATIVKDNLSSFFHKEGRFDRIDASNIADEGYLGISQTLEACGSLLKYQTENPHSALLTSLILCAKVVRAHSIKLGFTEKFLTGGSAELMKRLFPPINRKDTPADVMKRMAATCAFQDDNEMLRRYQEIYGFSEAATVSGMKPRDKNKILDKIPRQLKLSDNLEEARKQVERRMSYSGGNGIFVEWSTDREHIPMAPGMSENNRGEGIFGKLTLIE